MEYSLATFKMIVKIIEQEMLNNMMAIIQTSGTTNCTNYP